MDIAGSQQIPHRECGRARAQVLLLCAASPQVTTMSATACTIPEGRAIGWVIREARRRLAVLLQHGRRRIGFRAPAPVGPAVHRARRRGMQQLAAAQHGLPAQLPVLPAVADHRGVEPAEALEGRAAAGEHRGDHVPEVGVVVAAQMIGLRPRPGQPLRLAQITRRLRGVVHMDPGPHDEGVGMLAQGLLDGGEVARLGHGVAIEEDQDPAAAVPGPRFRAAAARNPRSSWRTTRTPAGTRGGRAEPSSATTISSACTGSCARSPASTASRPSWSSKYGITTEIPAVGPSGRERHRSSSFHASA